MSIEAMKQALEALEMYLKLDTMDEAHILEVDIAPKAITALRAAIEQAEKQEPVAWVNHGENRITRVTGWDGYGALYTTPNAAQRQPLTEDQIDDIWNRYCDEMGEASINDAYDIVRAIEAAHGIGEKK